MLCRRLLSPPPSRYCPQAHFLFSPLPKLTVCSVTCCCRSLLLVGASASLLGVVRSFSCLTILLLQSEKGLTLFIPFYLFIFFFFFNYQYIGFNYHSPLSLCIAPIPKPPPPPLLLFGGLCSFLKLPLFLYWVARGRNLLCYSTFSFTPGSLTEPGE